MPRNPCPRGPKLTAMPAVPSSQSPLVAQAPCPMSHVPYRRRRRRRHTPSLSFVSHRPVFLFILFFDCLSCRKRYVFVYMATPELL